MQRFYYGKNMESVINLIGLMIREIAKMRLVAMISSAIMVIVGTFCVITLHLLHLLYDIFVS